MKNMTEIYFREPASEALQGMVFLHDYIMCYCLTILGIVVWFSLCIVYGYGIRLHSREIMGKDLRTKHVRRTLRPYRSDRNFFLENFWTIFPAAILASMAVPSFLLLSMIERPRSYDVIVKVEANQWFWHYTIIVDFEDQMKICSFDSYMKSEAELAFGELRLLEVDNPLVLPVKVGLKFLISSEDVVHSFSVTELGIKMDAVPGRANRVWSTIDRTGVFRGQCSELCGVNHGFMPIVIYGVPYSDFLMWLDAKMKQV
jgi:heme/copper-type cytochrome/quinol oxidase subunit 2